MDTISAQTVAAYAAEHEISRFDEAAIERDRPATLNLANRFLTGYTGNFGFLLDVRARAGRDGLSPRQAAAILNCATQDAKRAAPRPAATVATPAPHLVPAALTAHEKLEVALFGSTDAQFNATRTTAAVRSTEAIVAHAQPALDHSFVRLGVDRQKTAWAVEAAPAPIVPAPASSGSTPAGRAIPDGTYTVVHADGTHTTLRLQVTTWGNFPAGTQTVSYLSGSDNESDYQGFAHLHEGRARIWRRYQESAKLRAALDVLLGLADPSTAGLAYAIESGRCWRCNRLLTVEDSIIRGLGPVCAAKLDAQAA